MLAPIRFNAATALLCCLILLPGLLTAGSVRAGTPEYRVGAGCTYSTIQAAVDAIPDQDDGLIRIRGGTYVENLEINNKSVELLGGHNDCTTASATSITHIDASGSASPVITYRANLGPAGTSHALYADKLNLFNGTGSGTAYGGGISVFTTADHSAAVTLNRTFVRNNQTTFFGGGIALRGEGSGSLALLENSQIENNTVTGSTPHGGGLYCEGDYTVTMLGGSIHGNTAGEPGATGGARGGGIYLDGCDMNWFAQNQTATSDDAALRNNTVYGDGGGLYATGGAQVDLIGAHFTLGDPTSTRPLRIHDNRALLTPGFGSGRGGAVYVGNAGASAGGSAVVRLDRTWVDDNHSDGSGGAFEVSGELVVERGSEACHTPRECSRVSGNTATTHAVINVLFGEATLRRTVIAGNSSSDSTADVMRVQTGGTLVIEDSLVHGNEADIGFRAAPPSTADGAGLFILRSTVAANAFASSIAQLGNDSTDVDIYDSIIHQPGSVMADTSGDPSISVDCVIWHDDQLGGSRTQVADPMFVDPAADLFYLQPGSPAINYCNVAPPAPGVDIDWNPRGILHSDQPAVHGPFDLGAYELPLGIFSDRFED